MSTLPMPPVDLFAEESVEKKSYNLAESFAEFLPVANDRNRLGFLIYRNLKETGDEPEMLVRNAKLTLKGISIKNFIIKVSDGIDRLKK